MNDGGWVGCVQWAIGDPDILAVPPLSRGRWDSVIGTRWGLDGMIQEAIEFRKRSSRRLTLFSPKNSALWDDVKALRTPRCPPLPPTPFPPPSPPSSPPPPRV